MTETHFPVPRTTVFNPSAWQNLDTNLYMDYPVTQNILMTFPVGIKTPSVASTGTGASDLLNIGIAPRTVGAVHHYSDGDNCVAGAGVHLNNGTNNNSATNIHNGTGANASGTVNIMSGSDNSGTVTIGNETTNNTTTTLRGNTTITNPICSPITLTYSTPTLSQMYFIRRSTSGFVTFQTTYRAFSPYNNLASGVYFLSAFVFMSSGFSVSNITCSLCNSSSVISNGQTGGFTILNDNTLEAYDFKSTTSAAGGNKTLVLSGIYTVLAPNNNIAMTVSTSVVSGGGYIDLKLCRIA